MPSQNRPNKVELPLADDAEIRIVVERFEDLTLPYVNWTHRAHLAVAVSYLRQSSLDDALKRMRENINAYNRKCGDPDGYNETVTVMFLKKIEAEAKKPGNRPSACEEVASLARICTVDWLYRYYSRELIWSGAAKAKWIPPDVAKLDFGT